MLLDVYLFGSSLPSLQGCWRLCLLKVEATPAVQPAAPARAAGRPNSLAQGDLLWIPAPQMMIMSFAPKMAYVSLRHIEEYDKDRVIYG